MNYISLIYVLSSFKWDAEMLFLLLGPALGLMMCYGHLEFLIIFKKEALHFNFAPASEIRDDGVEG